VVQAKPTPQFPCTSSRGSEHDLIEIDQKVTYLRRDELRTLTVDLLDRRTTAPPTKQQRRLP
jgi:hypothetical protein